MNLRQSHPNLLRTTLILFVFSFVIFSCNDDDDPITTTTIDDHLKSALIDQSQGEGLNFFTMPDSDEYNKIPQDPKNPLTTEKVALGQMLFHETALSVHSKVAEGAMTYSCASCHHAGGGFQACKPQGIGDGGAGYGTHGEGRDMHSFYQESQIDVQPIRTPSAMNSAYQSVTLWNGQFGAGDLNMGTESNWTAGTPKEKNHLGYLGLEIQAIAGLGVHRMDFTKEMAEDLGYMPYFNQVFSDFPEDRRYTLETAGLAIAAYERTILANQSPFQKWLKGDLHAMTEQEKNGAIVFFEKSNCADCHTGPALSSDQFNAIGLNDLVGDHIFQSDPNSDAHHGRGGFTGKAEDMFAYKVPQLYNMQDSPFFGHGSSFTTINAIVRYKNDAVKQNPKVPDSALDETFVPQNLSENEIQDLVAFLKDGLYDPDLYRYEPAAVLSGQCFPNNDPISRTDLGCN